MIQKIYLLTILAFVIMSMVKSSLFSFSTICLSLIYLFRFLINCILSPIEGINSLISSSLSFGKFSKDMSLAKNKYMLVSSQSRIPTHQLFITKKKKRGKGIFKISFKQCISSFYNNNFFV